MVDRVADDYRYRHPTRGERWFHQLSRARARDAAGRVVHTVGVIQDITERKAAELEARLTQNELAHATRMSVLGELAASMAHELNQPLAAILSNAQAARRFLAAPEPDMQEIREILDDIVRDDKRAGEVIHHMRAMVQKKGGAVPEPLDFNGLVRDTTKLVHSELVGRNVGLELDLAPKLPAFLAGRVEMQQVLLNLMVNAMDAMRDQPAERRRLQIRTSAAEGRVRVALRDYGHGIPENALADIFRPFFTTKNHGLGMGLSISRSMVEAHGGKLWAENAPDGGAVFWIDMPMGEGEIGEMDEGNSRGEGHEPENA
jgi:C4-dicarboxylate-specific signal transduction histidine kinase